MPRYMDAYVYVGVYEYLGYAVLMKSSTKVRTCKRTVAMLTKIECEIWADEHWTHTHLAICSVHTLQIHVFGISWAAEEGWKTSDIFICFVIYLFRAIQLEPSYFSMISEFVEFNTRFFFILENRRGTCCGSQVDILLCLLKVQVCYFIFDINFNSSWNVWHSV